MTLPLLLDSFLHLFLTFETVQRSLTFVRIRVFLWTVAEGFTWFLVRRLVFQGHRLSFMWIVSVCSRTLTDFPFIVNFTSLRNLLSSFPWLSRWLTVFRLQISGSCRFLHSIALPFCSYTSFLYFLHICIGFICHSNLSFCLMFLFFFFPWTFHRRGTFTRLRTRRHFLNLRF